jgi:hypothetical protein
MRADLRLERLVFFPVIPCRPDGARPGGDDPLGNNGIQYATVDRHVCDRVPRLEIGPVGEVQA